MTASTKLSKLTKHQYRIERITECAASGRVFVVLAKSVEYLSKVIRAAVDIGYTHDIWLQPAEYESQLTIFPDDVVVAFYPATKRVVVHNHRCGCVPVYIERPKRTFQDRCDKLLRKIIKRGENVAIPVSSQAHCDALYEAARKVGLTVDRKDYWTAYTLGKTHVLIHVGVSVDAVGVYNHDGSFRVYALPKE